MRIVAPLLILLVIGCNQLSTPPTLDCSTDATFKASLERMQQSMPAAEYDQVMRSLAAASIDASQFNPSPDGPPVPSVVAKPFHGMTGQQIIAHMERRKKP